MRFFKSPSLLIIILFCNLQLVYAQDPSYLKFSGGLNVIDNSNGFNIFWDVDQFEFSNPFFVELEGRFSEDMSFSIMATSNVFELKRLNNDGDGYIYPLFDFFAVNLTGKYYFDKYLFYNEDTNLDLYGGLGAGYHYVAEGGAVTFNVTFGANYWISQFFGVSVQAIANKGFRNEVKYVGDFYQYNIGLIYRYYTIPIARKKKRSSKSKSRKSSSNRKKSSVKVQPDNNNQKTKQAENDKKTKNGMLDKKSKNQESTKNKKDNGYNN